MTTSSDDAAKRRSMTGVEMQNLSVAYGRRVALARLSGRFAAGSLTAVVGPNGAGKSSLLKALARVVYPHAGTANWAAFAGHRLAYLPQQSELDRDFPITVAELVALGDWQNF